MEPEIRHPQFEILEKLRVELLTMGIIKDAVKEVAEEETITVSHEEFLWETFNLDNLIDPNKETIKERVDETQAEMEAEILAPQPVVENIFKETIKERVDQTQTEIEAEILAPQPFVENSEDKECVKEINQDKYVNKEEISADKKLNGKARIQKFFRRLFWCFPKMKAHKKKN